jgi:hypothetical protein
MKRFFAILLFAVIGSFAPVASAAHHHHRSHHRHHTSHYVHHHYRHHHHRYYHSRPYYDDYGYTYYRPYRTYGSPGFTVRF